MKKLLAVVVLVGAFGVAVFGADFLQTFTGAGGGGAITSVFRPGYQAWEKLRANTNTLNTYIKIGTGSPEAATAAGVSALNLRTDGGDGTAFGYKCTGSGNTGWCFPATAASTNTFTNKTLDAEGTGNLITIPFKEWFPAGACQDSFPFPTTSWHSGTAATNAPTSVCKTSAPTTAITAQLDFDDSATEYLYRDWLLPSDWIGAIDLVFVWRTSATTGNVVWQVATFCTAVGESMDETTWTYNTASTVTDAAQGTTLRQNTATITGLTTTGCAAGEVLHLKMLRNPAHASDTIAAIASLIGIEFTYRRAI